MSPFPPGVALRTSSGSACFHMAVALALLALTCGGCQRRPFYEYSQDDYASMYLSVDGRQLNSMLSSPYSDDREIACRVLAHRVRTALDVGEDRAAERLWRALAAHYANERSKRIRCQIVNVCAVEAGGPRAPVVEFLRQRLVEGGERIEAFHALSAVAPGPAAGLLLGFAQHPRAETRYQALLALLSLPPRHPEGARIRAAVAETLVDTEWLDDLVGRNGAEVRSSLQARLAAWSRGP